MDANGFCEPYFKNRIKATWFKCRDLIGQLCDNRFEINLVHCSKILRSQQIGGIGRNS